MQGPTIYQEQQSEDKTIVYVLVKKPEDIGPIAQPAAKQSKPEVFFIKYKTQQEQQSPFQSEEELPQEQPEQLQQPIIDERSKQPSQAPQFPALEGKEAQELLREEEAQQQREEQQKQQQQLNQPQQAPPQSPQPSQGQPQGLPNLPALPLPLPLPLPSRAPAAATGISPLPIDLAPAPKSASPAPPTQDYLPPNYK